MASDEVFLRSPWLPPGKALILKPEYLIRGDPRLVDRAILNVEARIGEAQQFERLVVSILAEHPYEPDGRARLTYEQVVAKLQKMASTSTMSTLQMAHQVYVYGWPQPELPVVWYHPTKDEEWDQGRSASAGQYRVYPAGGARMLAARGMAYLVKKSGIIHPSSRAGRSIRRRRHWERWP